MKACVSGMDVHCQTTDVTVLTASGRVCKRDRVATRIPELRALIETMPRTSLVVIEEGPPAHRLIRNLSP